MDEPYLIYVIGRGYFTQSGFCSSEWQSAAHYSREQALSIVRDRIMFGEPGALMVRYSDMEAILDLR